jgi:hypothetical protein
VFSLRHYPCKSVAAAVGGDCAAASSVCLRFSAHRNGITTILHTYKNSPSNNRHGVNIVITLIAVVITVE